MTNGTYQFSLDANFGSVFFYEETLEGFMDLVSIPFSLKQNLRTLCKKYLKMKGTWK